MINSTAPNPKGPKIVMIGGGTGSFTLLKELKNYAQDITALVNMADDGGSTGVLRDEYGVLPPGDIRQCLVALSNSSKQMRDLFNYRFGDGSFKGHSFGNVFLTAVQKMTNDFGESVKLAGEVLNISGRVIPITLDNTHLVMLDNNVEVFGEYKIGQKPFKGKNRPEFKLQPHAWINPEARHAINNADIVIIAPGNLYGSLVPALIVDGVADALQSTKAKVIQVTNLVTKPGQTDGWTVCDYVDEIERFIGKNVVDVVLYNTAKPNSKMLKQYTADGEYPVGYKDTDFLNAKYTAIGKDLVSKEIPSQNPNDVIERTLIRHNSDEVARQVMRVYYS